MARCGNSLVVARTKARVSQEVLAKGHKLYKDTLIDIEKNRIGLDKETYNELLATIEKVKPEGLVEDDDQL